MTFIWSIILTFIASLWRVCISGGEGRWQGIYRDGENVVGMPIRNANDGGRDGKHFWIVTAWRKDRTGQFSAIPFRVSPDPLAIWREARGVTL